MIQVKATREGLAGQLTASGWHITNDVLFVALPSHKALGRSVRIHNPATQLSCTATVKDVGPWNIDDDAYVFQFETEGPHTSGTFVTEQRPLAEMGIKTDGHKRIKGPTNSAGIDLGEAVWLALGMRDNGLVAWEFAD